MAKSLIHQSSHKRQAVPVIANEFIIRTFYFIRRLADELG